MWKLEICNAPMISRLRFTVWMDNDNHHLKFFCRYVSISLQDSICMKVKFSFFFHSNNWLETWVNITNFFSWKEMRSRPHDVVHPVKPGIFQHSKNFMIPIWLLFHKVENFSRFLKAKSFNAKIVRKLS